MSAHYDVIIVGGGFAGLALAKRAAQLGLDVLVLDRKPVAGHAPHTTGIIVKEAVELLQVPPHLTRRVSGIRLYSPALKSYDLVSEGYYFLTTDTSGYLRFMAEQAREAGATLQFGCEFQGGFQQGDRVILPDLDVSCDFLIGADGARSKVAQHFGLSVNQQFLIGVEAEYRGIENLDPDRLHCFLDASLAKGYIAWAAPGVHCVQVGLACSAPHKPDLKALTDKLSGVFDFSGAQCVGHRGGLIPVGGKLRRLAQGRVLLLGDAAGVVSPLTAGGIYPALFTGARLAEAIDRHRRQQGPAPAEVLNRLYPDYTWKSLLRVALTHSPPNPVLEAVMFNPLFQSMAQTVFFHHRGLLSPRAWQEMLLNRPALSGK